MDWIKRNLVLVVVAALALGLLGYGGFLLYTTYQRDAEITGNLEGQIANFTSLQDQNPHPGDDKVDNIKTAKEDQRRMGQFLATARKSFAEFTIPPSLDNASFRNLLDNTVSELRRDAEKSGVSLAALPPNYGFTFAAQLGSVQYVPTTLEPLALQLAEIRALSEILFRANVHSLLGMRRVPVAPSEETFGSMDYLLGKRLAADPDTGATISPYEVSFQGFSTELASVLEGLYRSPYCFVVKNITVEKGTGVAIAAEGEAGTEGNMAARYGLVPAPVTPGGAAPGSPSDLVMRRYGIAAGGGKQDGPGGGLDAAMRSRYGLGGGGRYGGGGAQPPPPPVAPQGPVIVGVAPPTQPSRTITTILDESPLRVTLQIDSIRFTSTPPSKPQKPAAP